MSRLEIIRQEEKKYHDFCYDNYRLFEKGSWLYKPVKTVMEVLPLLTQKRDIRVLDLGSGVGRNAIPIAQEIKNNGGKVVCVDLLDSALNKLKQYSKEYDVDSVIETRKADIGHYEIATNGYDLIVAVSALEHVGSESIFIDMIREMTLGTKKGGINCLIVNSEVEEIDFETNEKRDAMLEVNMQTEEMITRLREMYRGWEVLKQLVKPLEYTIVRDEKEILLRTNAITYVVRK